LESDQLRERDASTTAWNLPLFASALASPWRRTAVQAVRFAVVGLGNTATCLAVIWLCRVQLHLAVWFASGVGYAIGTAQSYALNRAWTFAGHASEARVATQAAAFLTVNVVCGLIFAWLNAGLSAFVSLPVATVLTMAVVTPLSFGLNRWLVFRANHKGAER